MYRKYSESDEVNTVDRYDNLHPTLHYIHERESENARSLKCM